MIYLNNLAWWLDVLALRKAYLFICLYTTRASDGINNIIFGFTYGVERSTPPNYSARNSFVWWLLSTKHF